MSHSSTNSFLCLVMGEPNCVLKYGKQKIKIYLYFIYKISDEPKNRDGFIKFKNGKTMVTVP